MSTNAINPVISTLLETLSSQSPALARPAVQNAIASASPQDVVALSEAALAAQTVAGLFDEGDSSAALTLDPASLLSNLVQSATAATPGTQVAPLGNFLAALQYQQAAALLGGEGTTSVVG